MRKLCFCCSILLCLFNHPLAAAEHALILQYHHVSDTTPAATSITPRRFAAHLEWLATNGYQVWPLPEVVKRLQKKQALPDKVAAITFDDGYDSVYDNAFPLLKQHGWPFTIFINTEPVDRNYSSHATWSQVLEMANQGATIANHTLSHPYLVRQLNGENEQQQRERIKREILDAEQRIAEKTGQNHKLLAYPYGEATISIRNWVREAGFVAFGQQSGPAGFDSDLSILPRFPLSGNYSALTGFAEKMRSLPMPLAKVSELDDVQDGVLAHETGRPRLTITLKTGAYATGQLRCFASGQGIITITKQGDDFLVQADQPLPPGRSRYNCTMPSSQPGRYYWYSHPWLRFGPAAQWVHE